MDTAFEQQAAQLMATAAGPEIALDVRDVVAELRPELMIVDCMLPAGIAAGIDRHAYGLARALPVRARENADAARSGSARISVYLTGSSDGVGTIAA